MPALPTTRTLGRTGALITIAIATAASPTIANAAPRGSATQAQMTTLKYDAKSRKYCLTEPAVTGTRIDRITCRTASAWAASGLDMPKELILAQK